MWVILQFIFSYFSIWFVSNYGQHHFSSCQYYHTSQAGTNIHISLKICKHHALYNYIIVIHIPRHSKKLLCTVISESSFRNCQTSKLYVFSLSLRIKYGRKLAARSSCPLLRRANKRALIVGQGWLGGAHFNHLLSISLK